MFHLHIFIGTDWSALLLALYTTKLLCFLSVPSYTQFFWML